MTDTTIEQKQQLITELEGKARESEAQAREYRQARDQVKAQLAEQVRQEQAERSVKAQEATAQAALQAAASAEKSESALSELIAKAENVLRELNEAKKDSQPAKEQPKPAEPEG